MCDSPSTSQFSVTQCNARCRLLPLPTCLLGAIVGVAGRGQLRVRVRVRVSQGQGTWILVLALLLRNHYPLSYLEEGGLG